MSEAVMDFPNNHEFNDESFIVARLLDFNGNQHDENTAVEMMIEGSVCVRNNLKNLALKMADELDATIAKHAEEKEEYERQAAEKLEALQRKCDAYEQTFNDLVQDSNTKLTVNLRIKQFLRFINDRK